MRKYIAYIYTGHQTLAKPQIVFLHSIIEKQTKCSTVESTWNWRIKQNWQNWQKTEDFFYWTPFLEDLHSFELLFYKKSQLYIEIHICHIQRPLLSYFKGLWEFSRLTTAYASKISQVGRIRQRVYSDVSCQARR